MHTGKEPFNIDQTMYLIQEVVKQFPKAALFQLADEGYRSVFELTLACILSTRTLNRLLVPFGKHICTSRLLKCSTCPVLTMCKQVNVNKHR